MRPFVSLVVCSMVLVAMSAMAQAPVVPQGGVVNGASFRPANATGGGVSAGAIVSIFGSNLATATVVAGSLPLPTSLGGTTVRIGGAAAPMFFVSAGQINAQVPWNVATGTAQLMVTTAAGTSAVANVTIQDASPGLFSQTSNGRGPGAVLNYVSQQQTPINTPGVTINPGGIVILYGTGFGRVGNPPADGVAAGAATQTTLVSPTVMIGGRQATVQYSGLAPGFVGLYQINAVIPAGTPEGCYLPITVTFAGTVSNTVTAAVTNNRVDCNAVAGSGATGMTLGGSIGAASVVKTSVQMSLPSIPGLPGGLPGLPGLPGLGAVVTDSFGASFSKYEVVVPSSLALYPPVNGGCTVWLFKGTSSSIPDMGVVTDKPLNAGTLTLTGPGVNKTFTPKTVGVYGDVLSQNALQPGAWTLSGSGGADVGSFTSALSVPSPLFNITDFGLLNGQIKQSAGFTVTWACPDPNGQVIETLMSFNDPQQLVGMAFCTFPCPAGRGTMGADVLGQLPVSSGDFGTMLSVSFAPGPTGISAIKASGLTQGAFAYAIASVMMGAPLVP
jgi:uncharacterized protein (TIGR03437 family)